MRFAISIVLMGVTASCAATRHAEPDRAAVLATLEFWNRGWAEADASMAVEDYSENADWTNAFGDRF